MDQEETFSIGEAARASGLSVKTIRYYEEIGLIPKPRRSNVAARTGGDRTFTATDVGRLQFIRHARLFDLGLGDIRDMLALAEKGCPGGQPEYQSKLERHLEKIEERIRHLLGLRDAMRRLLEREPSACGGGVDVWTSCGCMSSAPTPKRDKRRSAARFPEGRPPGERPSACCAKAGCEGGTR